MNVKNVGAILMIIAIIGILVTIPIAYRGCHQHIVKEWGGSLTIRLKPNIKLLNVTWKEEQLWLLTTDRTNELPKTYNFTERTKLGILRGNVKIIEK